MRASLCCVCVCAHDSYGCLHWHLYHAKDNMLLLLGSCKCSLLVKSLNLELVNAASQMLGKLLPSRPRQAMVMSSRPTLSPRPLSLASLASGEGKARAVSTAVGQCLLSKGVSHAGGDDVLLLPRQPASGSAGSGVSCLLGSITLEPWDCDGQNEEMPALAPG